MKNNYAGIPDECAAYANAKVVLLPVPYDGTSTWQKGADKGPAAFLDASENMELYDIETDSEPYLNGIALLNPISENSSPEAMTEAVYQATKKEIDQGKFFTLFGGEHSVSIGAIKAHYENFEDITIVQIDAHADLRPSYEGSACNHACAVFDASKNTNLIQVGIRSMDVAEKEHMDLTKTYFAHQIAAMKDDGWQEDALQKMTENIYITIDLDAFDPSECPSTGTPEPGGLSFYQVTTFLKKIFKTKNVVGFDIVELCPNDLDKSSDFLAAKLYYKMLAYKFSKH